MRPGQAKQRGRYVKKTFLFLAACFSAASAWAAVVATGAGSYADSIPEASYGCAVDHGNWIVSAGVVQPGIGGCDPLGDYNGIPYGTPVKPYPHRVGTAAQKPTGTHRWWGSVSFCGEGQVNGSGAGYLTADPMMARVTNRGVRVLGIPNGMRVDPRRFTYLIPAPSEEVFDGIAIGNSLYSNLNAYLKDYSEGSVTVEWRSGSTPVMEATLVHGSPYMYFEVYAGAPVIRTKAVRGPEKGVFFQSANSLGVQTNVASVRTHFMVVTEGATTFNNPSATETSFAPANGRFTLVWLPVTGAESPTTAMITELTQYALNRVVKVNINYAVNPSTQAVTVTHDYLVSTGALRIGFSNDSFSSPTAPRTRQNRGGTQRPKRLNLPLDAGRRLLGVDSRVERRLSWRHLRVSPWRRATSICPEIPRAQPIPVALLCGPPER